MEQSWVKFVKYSLAITVAGCSGPVDSTDINVGAASEKLVQYGVSVTTSSNPSAAETAMLVSVQNGVFKKIVAYNFDDPAHVSYTATHRTTTSGASLAGWSYAGKEITDPFAAPQRLTPPVGWPILWGDPALGQVGGTGYVYLTSLAVPTSKMPASGTITDGLNNFLGGACIARSTNGGQNFTLAAADCVHTPAFDFYDGADIAGSIPGGPVYAAFRNVTTGHIDVWRAPTPTSPFVQLSDPFGSRPMVSHPRLTWWGGTGSGGAMIVAGADNVGNLVLHAHSASGWITSSWPRIVGSNYSASEIVVVNGVTIRMNGGAQFEPVTVWNQNHASTIRVIYATRTNGHATFAIAECDPTTTGCGQSATIDPGTNVFHPAAASGSYVSSPQAGILTDASKATWVQQTGPNTVALFSGNWRSRGAITGRQETGDQTPCQDTRGYWGDYDSHMGMVQGASTEAPLFWRSFTDSTGGTCTREAFRASPVNVSATWINP